MKAFPELLWCSFQAFAFQKPATVFSPEHWDLPWIHIGLYWLILRLDRYFQTHLGPTPCPNRWVKLEMNHHSQMLLSETMIKLSSIVGLELANSIQMQKQLWLVDWTKHRTSNKFWCRDLGARILVPRFWYQGLVARILAPKAITVKRQHFLKVQP